MLQNLAFALLVGVIHDNDNALDAGNQIHGSPHALDELAGDHPVGEIAIFGDFHCPKNRQVDVTAPDHPKGLGRGEIGSPGKFGDGLLASIDQIGSTSSSVGNGPMPSMPFSDCSVISISDGT